jgi:16S rRNA (guanine527-N7)-methyltransferase
MEAVLRYFNTLTDVQKGQYSKLQDLYSDWNEKINVISRKDIENLYERHVLHSLAVAEYSSFVDDTHIIDLGCGGGFPGIPLAIFFPNVHFHLVDSIRKKLTVVDAICEELEIRNVKTSHSRVEDIKEKADFIVVRAVAQLPKLIGWSRNLIKENHKNSLPNGMICLKGGDLKSELKSVPRQYYTEQTPISNYFSEPFFEEKHIVYVQL